MKKLDEIFLSEEGKIKLSGCGCFPDEECDFDPENDVNNEVEFCCVTTIPDNLTFNKNLNKLAITYKFKDKLRCCVEPCDFNVDIGGIPCFSKICLIRLVGCIEFAVSVPLIEGDKTVGFNTIRRQGEGKCPPGPEVYAGCASTVCVNNIVDYVCAPELPDNLEATLCPDLTEQDVTVKWADKPVKVQICRNQKIIKFRGKFILPKKLSSI